MQLEKNDSDANRNEVADNSGAKRVECIKVPVDHIVIKQALVI